MDDVVKGALHKGSALHFETIKLFTIHYEKKIEKYGLNSLGLVEC